MNLVRPPFCGHICICAQIAAIPLPELDPTRLHAVPQAA